MAKKITLNGQFRKSISEVFEEFVVSRTASGLSDVTLFVVVVFRLKDKDIIPNGKVSIQGLLLYWKTLFSQVCFQFFAFDGAFGPGVGLEVFFQKKKSDADVVFSVVRPCPASILLF